MTRADLVAMLWRRLDAYHQALSAQPHGTGRCRAQASLVDALADLADDYADTRRHRRVPPEVAAAARAEEARLASESPGSAGPAGPPGPVTLMARRHLLAEAAKPGNYRRKDNCDEGTAGVA